jgi:murein DD-endopeptidase MepM/ murein hydrolase activator NlpD
MVSQNFFVKVREKLKKYWFNWKTQQVEHDESEMDAQIYGQKVRNDKKTFRVRSSAVVASTFLVLLGAGMVDAQTRAYEVIYKGTSIGYVENLSILESAVKQIPVERSGRRSVDGRDYEVRSARTSDFLTADQVVRSINEVKTEDKLKVANADNSDFEDVLSEASGLDPSAGEASTATATSDGSLSASGDEAIRVTAAVEQTPAITPTISTTAVETVAGSETATIQTQAVEEAPAETAAVEVPVAESIPQTQVVEASPAEPTPVETAPAATPVSEGTPEIPAAAPAVETPVTADPPTADAPAPAETPVTDTPATETPQGQFTLPASGRIGEIFRVNDGGYYSNHYGGAAVDILNSEGTPIYAAAGGTVTLADWYGGYGNCVIIDHGNGYTTLYGHFSSLDVAVGQTVSQGQQIGSMGSTGSSTANHVHFEIRQNGTAQPINNYFSISTGDYV